MELLLGIFNDVNLVVLALTAAWLFFDIA